MLDALLKKVRKCYIDASFDDATQELSIIGQMPDYENYKKKFAKLAREASRKDLSDMRPCYEAPLLNKIQEVHLFKKYNFLKYQARKILEKENPDNPNHENLAKATTLINSANEVRNQIACANFRLISLILRMNLYFQKQRSLCDQLFSDCFFTILKSIEFYDWTRGYKFSTYCVWALKKNFFTSTVKEKKILAHYDSFNELGISINKIPDSRDFIADACYASEVQNLSSKSLNILQNHTDSREFSIIESYFGLNGKKEENSAEIGRRLNLSRERIRQIKNHGIAVVRSAFKFKLKDVDALESK